MGKEQHDKLRRQVVRGKLGQQSEHDKLQQRVGHGKHLAKLYCNKNIFLKVI